MDNITLNKLEKDILDLYGNGIPLANHKNFYMEGIGALLNTRKAMRDSKIMKEIRNNDIYKILPVIKEFNDKLKKFLKAKYKQAEKLQKYLFWKLGGREYILLLNCWLADCPPECAQTNIYGNSLWDILNNSDYHLLYEDGLYEEQFFVGKESVTKEYRSKMGDKSMFECSIYPILNKEREAENRKGIAGELLKHIPDLIWPVLFLIQDSYFALSDYIYCRKFRSQMSIIDG